MWSSKVFRYNGVACHKILAFMSGQVRLWFGMIGQVKLARAGIGSVCTVQDVR
jgi:hypothetical protein